MKYLITTLAFLLAADGLWSHDWRMILAGAATAAIWPLINADFEAAEHEELPDELWSEQPSVVTLEAVPTTARAE